MEIIESPNPVDEPNLIYKLQTKRRIFDEGSFNNRGYNLVETSSKYGLVFIGMPVNELSVYYLSDIINVACEHPPRLGLPLPEPPTHITISNDNETLAVCTSQYIHLYSVQALQNESVTPVSVRITDNAAGCVVTVQWNPCLADTLALAFSDGSLLVGQLKGAQFTFNRVPAKAMCLCWSPKGKQIVTGNSDGSLLQYKPELTAVKMIPAPNLANGSQVEALAVHWISNYQFAVVYRNASDSSRPYVTIVNTPKGGASVCFNYEDICYSMSTIRPWYYYLLSVTQWGLLIAASSNSVEVASLGTRDGTSWLQWCQLEEAKPELPLTDNKQDSYPVGIAFNTSAIHQLPWGENDILPHMPLMLVLSHTGLLVTFNAINLAPGAPQLCSPPQQLTLPHHKMISDAPQPVTLPPSAPAPNVAPPSYSQSVFAPTAAVTSQPAVQAPSAPVTPYQSAATQPTPFKPSHEVKSTPEQALQPQQKTTPLSVPAQQTAEPKESTIDAKSQAKQSEELRAAAAKANEEMRAMLVKEVNSFQNELYKFVVKSRDINMKIDTTAIIELNSKLQTLNAEQIEKECSTESLTAAIVELKLDIVKTFALLAEARCQNEEDAGVSVSVCSRLVAAVRRRARRLQTELDTAERALWRQRGAIYAPADGERMSLPTLDTVYRPLVKQQEILNRQSALVHTLAGAMRDVTTSYTHPTIIKGFTKDPLSKLSKKVLNMSLDHKETKPSSGLSPQKLDALRDLLSNRKTVRIKPINYEVQRHLASMQDTHARLLEETRELRLRKQQTNEPIRAEEKEPSPPFEPMKTKPESKESKPKSQSVPSKPAPVSQSTPVQKQGLKDQPKLPTPQAIIMEGPPITQKMSMLNWAQGPDVSQQNAWGRPQELSASMNQMLDWMQDQQKDQNNVLNWVQQKPAESSGKSVTITPSNLASVAKTLFTEGKSLEEKATTSKGENAEKAQQKKNNAQAKKTDENTFFGQKICSPTSVQGSKSLLVPTLSDAKNKSAFSGTPAFSTAFDNAKNFTFGKSTKKKTEISKNEANSETGEKVSENAKNLNAPVKKEEQIEGNNEPKLSIFGNLSLGQAENKTGVAPSESTIFGVKPSSKDQESKQKVAESSLPTVDTKADTTKSKEVDKILNFTAGNKDGPQIASVFGGDSSKASSTFGAPTAVSASNNSTLAPTSAASVFASAAVKTAPTAKSVFASATALASSAVSPTPPTPSAVSPPASATAATPTATGNLFAANAAAAAALAAANATAKEAGSVKGSTSPLALLPTPEVTPTASAASAAPSVGSIFGTPPPAITTAATIFGSSPSPASIFGAPAASVFGSSPVNPSSVFGASAATATPPAPQASIFGAPSATSVFGSSNAAPSPQSVFGASTTTSTPSVFGSPSTTTPSPSSIFGAQAAKTSPVFGSPNTTNAFGTTPGGASVFGSPVSSAQSASMFGAPTTTTPTGSVFGSAATPATSGSIFGAAEATSMFGATSISGAPQPTGNVFGGGSPSGGSVFGGSGSGNVFGAKPVFGQPNQSNVFGGSTTFGQQKPATSVFGASPTFGSAFSSPSTQASSIFGGGGGGFGAAPQPSAFGTPSPGAQTSIFGTPEQNKPASVFGTPPQSGSAFGGGAVFGSKPVFGQQSGFGSGFGSSSVSQGGFGAPAFGNKSPSSGGFGGGAVFGGSPTFGGGAAFGGGGSPGKVFGGSPGFGAPMQQSSTFEKLADQNTLSFGNLAQQTQPQPAAFNTSPSFSGWRG